MKQFNLGDIVYFIASNRIIREAKVIRNADGFVTIKFPKNLMNLMLFCNSPKPHQVLDIRIIKVEDDISTFLL